MENTMPTFQIPDMSCGHCVGVITQAVHTLDPTARVTTELSTHRVHIEPGQASDAALGQALSDAGYPATLVEAAEPVDAPAAARSSSRRV